MKIRVMYYSRSGNTKKVADAIASSVGLKAETVPPSFPLENVDLLLLGTGIYAGKPHSKLRQFVESLNVKRVKNVAVFGTCGGQDSAVKQVQDILKNKGVNVVDEAFLCKGRTFFFISRSHPDENDLKEAQGFAKRVVEKLEK